MTNLIINKNIELKLGLEWLKRSFVTFREYPVQFILLGIVNIICMIIPFIGVFLMTLLVAQFMVLATKVDNNQKIFISEVFSGLFARSQIIRLGFIEFCLSAIIVIAQYLIEALLQSGGSLPAFISPALTLVFIILRFLLQASMWLAPIICIKNSEIDPKVAMWWSFKATFFNIPTLFIYSILIIPLILLALLPIGLGLLILMPIINISIYHIYYSLFRVGI